MKRSIEERDRGYGNDDPAGMNSSPRDFKRRRYEGDDRRYHQRPRYERDNRRNGHAAAAAAEENGPEERLKNLIFQLADNCNSSNDKEYVQSSISNAANLIIEQYEDHHNAISKTLFACASQLSWKLHVYVVLMGVINDRNYDLAREISKKLIESFESLFTLSAEHDQKKWPKIRCCLRFFGELSLTNFYASESIVNLLHSMSSAESINPNLAYAVMATLPWLASRLQEKHSDDLMKLVAGLEDFVNTLECPTVSLDMIEKPEFSANPLLQDCLVKVKGMRDGLGWQSELTQKPAIYDQFASVLEDQVSQEFNAAPNLDTMDEGKAIMLRTPLYLFDADSSDEAFYPDKYSVDRWLLHELLWCTIAAFEINHRECVKTLFEKFSLPDVGAKKYNLHRAIVETVMEDLFQVSGPSFKSVFHSVVLMGCCKASPTTIPKELGKIIYLVYDHCESMNFALLDRFTDWMSHHLSNFDFKWNWADWSDVLNMESDSAQYILVQQLLEKMVRLSYMERIEGSIPSDFHPLLPATPSISNATYEDDVDHKVAAGKIVTTLKAKPPASEVLSMLDHLDQLKNQDERRDVFLPCLFQLGSKSFSHTLNIIERNLAVLQRFCESESDKLKTISVTYECAKNHHQYFTIVMDKFINYRLLDAESLVEWAMRNEELCNHYWYWQILAKVLSKFRSSSSKASEIWEKLGARFEKHGNVRIQQFYIDLRMRFFL